MTRRLAICHTCELFRRQHRAQKGACGGVGRGGGFRTPFYSIFINAVWATNDCLPQGQGYIFDA